ncbi:MAG: phage integrase family protein [Burkholderia sp.]
MNAPVEQLTLPPPRTYTRSDFAALRAWVQRVPLPTIAQRYYDPDTTLYEDDAAALERHLKTMRDDLVHLALLNGSSALAEHLKTSIRQHGSARLTAVSFKMVEAAAELAAAAPASTHAVGLWFRPPIARRLAGEGIGTLGELIAFCNRRGGRWWRRVPRIGAGRARVLVAWLRTHAQTLGATIAADVDMSEPIGGAAPAEAIALAPADGGRVLAPLERLALPHALSGAAGTNRAPGLCYLHADHDLDALRAYLARYADQPATLRAYTRELERLLLWAITVRGTALSSLTVEDGDVYKAFLRAPSDAFVGPPASRASGRWRPFAPGGLSLDSQRYAIRAIRGAFDWLVDVRYLAGNPWRAVRDPKPVQRVSRMQIDRALPATLWDKVRTALDAHCERAGPDAPRWRTTRALLLLMGDSGLRIAEAAAATRDQLQQLPADGDLPASWQLTVVGKGSKARVTPVSEACAAAIVAHWRDRGADFDAGTERRALVAPLTLPSTPNANAKAARLAAGELDEIGGYAVRPARGLVAWALAQLQASWPATLPDLSEAERQQLARTSPHALRHTFGTQTVAAGVPLDVAQRVLGHASLQTTTVYVTAEQRRIRAELGRYFGKRAVASAAPAPAPEIDTPTTNAAVPAERVDAIQVAGEAAIRTATVHLTLDIRNNSKYVRGRKRSIEAIEFWILDEYEAVKVVDGEYDLRVPYGCDQELDDLMYELLRDIQITADDRHCFSESRAQLIGSDRAWS